jgi:nicotinamide-nucleotide amidase
MKITNAWICRIKNNAVEPLFGDIDIADGKISGIDEKPFDPNKVFSEADQEKDIIAAFEEAFIRADLVLITGGLGPTHDDITKKALANYFDCPISINSQALEEIQILFEKRGFILSETNK